MDIIGTNEDDFLAGTIGSDRIDAFDDDDTIVALGGDDVIFVDTPRRERTGILLSMKQLALAGFLQQE
ncbi:hypothetical protein FM036_20420 [Nostoc sp. HG1]|nr:hypothetical protein [Nostoc sp. HG1]